MNKHTPGPWFCEEPNIKKQHVDISTKANCPTTGYVCWSGLARAYGCEDDRTSGTAAMMANARLIAAAPELLEALILLLDKDDSGEDEIWVRVKARAAIAKATGEPQ